MRLWLLSHREQYASGLFLARNAKLRVPGGEKYVAPLPVRCLQTWTTFAKSMFNTLSSQNKKLIARSAKYLKALIQIKRV